MGEAGGFRCGMCETAVALLRRSPVDCLCFVLVSIPLYPTSFRYIFIFMAVQMRRDQTVCVNVTFTLMILISGANDTMQSREAG